MSWQAERPTVSKITDKPPAADAIVLTNPDGSTEVLYEPTDLGRRAHACTTPNFLLEGERGTGKSTILRWDCHLKALAYPGYKYLILRRTMPELRKSHLLFLSSEMRKLGGFYHKTNVETHYANGSVGLFGHCETEQDIERYLSAEFYQIVFDEIVTFPWDWVTRIAASCRVPRGSGLMAFVRGGTNPLGVSADEVYRYFIARDIGPDEDPEYAKDEWGSIHTVMDDNPHLDKDQYLKRFQGLPEAYRKAWLLGEWGVEGAYFSLRPEHETRVLPELQGPDGQFRSMLAWPWLHVYRVVDFGWHDPTVCLWVAVLPNGRYIPFKEKLWVQTPVQTIARDILRESDGMRVVGTLADPTLWAGEREMGHSLADEFERAGISLTKAKNDRTAAGFAIQEHLNRPLKDGHPQLIVYDPQRQGIGCPTLLKTLRAMRVDKKHPGRIADHKQDHLPICLGYFCMAAPAPTIIPTVSRIPQWMQPKTGTRFVLGSEGVRSRRI